MRLIRPEGTLRQRWPTRIDPGIARAEAAVAIQRTGIDPLHFMGIWCAGDLTRIVRRHTDRRRRTTQKQEKANCTAHVGATRSEESHAIKLDKERLTDLLIGAGGKLVVLPKKTRCDARKRRSGDGPTVVAGTLDEHSDQDHIARCVGRNGTDEAAIFRVLVD